MNPRHWLIVPSLLLLCASALAGQDQPATAPATMPATVPAKQSPKEMLLGYNAAMRRGDAEAIEKLFVANNETEQRVARALARSEVQVGKMLVAANDKFGPEGVARIQKAFRDNSDADIEAAEVTIRNGRAFVSFPQGGQQQFVLVDGYWKASMAEAIQDVGGNADLLIDNWSRRGNFAKVLAQDIGAGQVKTADEAIARIQQRDAALRDDSPPN